MKQYRWHFYINNTFLEGERAKISNVESPCEKNHRWSHSWLLGIGLFRISV